MYAAKSKKKKIQFGTSVSVMNYAFFSLCLFGSLLLFCVLLWRVFSREEVSAGRAGCGKKADPYGQRLAMLFKRITLTDSRFRWLFMTQVQILQ